MSSEYFSVRKDQYLIFEQPNAANLLCGYVKNIENTDMKRRLVHSLDITDTSRIYGLLFFNRCFTNEFSWPPTIYSHISKHYVKTPYFNPISLPAKPYTCIITSSKETNGFYRSSGITRLIPVIYSFIQREWLFKYRNISMFHFLPKCYHSKAVHAQCDSKIHILFYGSSNYNTRSVLRDEEIHLSLFNPDRSLLEYFHNVYILC